MAIFTERQAIKERLTEITEERRRLGEEYSTLLNRLRELDNMEREAVDVDGVIGELSKAVSTLGALIPEIPIDVLINHAVGGLGQVAATAETTGKLNVPEHEVLHQQYVDSNKHLEKPRTHKVNHRTRQRLKGVDTTIVKVLKETRREMTMPEILEQVQKVYEVEIHEKSFYSRLRKVVEEEPNVVKPGRGLYRYQI